MHSPVAAVRENYRLQELGMAGSVGGFDQGHVVVVGVLVGIWVCTSIVN